MLGAFELGCVEWVNKPLPPLLPHGQRKQTDSEEDAVKGLVFDVGRIVEKRPFSC
jgi:hypothetical protein